MERAINVLVIGFGVLILANAVIAGPHAFQSGMSAVVAMTVAGLLCIAAGTWGLVRRHGRRKRTATGLSSRAGEAAEKSSSDEGDLLK